MFKNLGDKMAGISVATFFIGIIVSVLAVIGCFKTAGVMNELRSGSGDIFYLVGVIGGGISIFKTYAISIAFAAIGEISDSIHKIEMRNSRIKEGLASNITPRNKGISNFRKSALGHGETDKNGPWRCKTCGEDNTSTAVFCASCGEHR